MSEKHKVLATPMSYKKHRIQVGNIYAKLAISYIYVGYKSCSKAMKEQSWTQHKVFHRRDWNISSINRIPEYTD